ncbi:MAG: NADH-quinone oxidoreductase subunit NuoB [Endomicrobiales bacterium]|jgi:Ni,Fe-hydrogenase III small subunit
MIPIVRAALVKGTVTLPADHIIKEIESLGKELSIAIDTRFGRSFHIREVDTGSCGACESEIIALTNPLYDIQRFGVDIVASPRHADALLVTGPVSRNMAAALKDTFDAMASPKWVITCGNCALDGGLFRNSYYVLGGVGSVLPVDAHIHGCPPKPIEIIKTLLSLIKSPGTPHCNKT